MTTEPREQAVLDAETARCAAIAGGDMDRLASLLHDEYLHIHGTGRIGDKADYIAGVRRIPRAPVRDNLRVRLFGDTAVLTGDLYNTLSFPGEAPRRIDTSATFVLREEDGRWLFVSGQLTPQRDVV